VKAAILTSPFNIQVKEIVEPKIGPKEVLVKPMATAICGTDIRIYNGSLKVKLPLIMGHEVAGCVIEVGKECEKIKVGDRVHIYPIIYCGTCYMCKTGKVYLCSSGGLIGRDVNGAFAEYVSVPEYLIYKLPDNISYEEGALAGLVWNVFHAHTRVKISIGDSVAVLGMSAAGLLHVALARISGAYPVIAISRSQWKLELAKKFGADIVINARQTDVLNDVLEATGGRGADIVIESAGTPQTILQSMKLVKPGGIILQFGICAESINNYNAYPIYFKEISIIGTRAMRPLEYEPAMKLLASGRIDVKPLITHKFPLEKIREAFELIDKKPNEVLRALITYQSESFNSDR